MSNRSSYWGPAAVALLAWCIAIPCATLASAAGSPTYYGTGITVRYHNRRGAIDFHHVPPIPVGTHLDLGCRIKAGGRSNPGWSTGIYANGHPLLVRPSTARDVRAIHGVFSIGVSNWMVTVPGHNSVSCRLAINGSGSELLAPALAFNATGHAPHDQSHTTNWNSSPADSNWDSSPAGSSGSGGNSGSPHAKACKSTLTADVELQPNQLRSPMWQPEAAGVQVPRIVLPLQSSTSAGNSVTCTYASVHGNVTLTTKLDCTNAQMGGGRHIYSCE